MSGSSTRADGYRTLADQLRGWPDERLSRLLARASRPRHPAPHDFGQLASRAATRSSLLRALDLLTRLELSVLDALVVAGQTTSAELTHRWSTPIPRAVDAALDRLRRPGAGLGVRPGAAPAQRRRPTGCAAARRAGLSGLRPRSADPAAAGRGGAAARRAVRRRPGRCSSTSPTAAARRPPAPRGTPCSPRTPRTPAEELLARRLLVPRGGGIVVLPGEVGLALRGGRTTREPVDDEPELVTSDRDARPWSTAVAAGAAFEAVRRVELLLDQWGTDAARRAAQRRPRRPRPQGDRAAPARRRGPRPRCSSSSPRPRAAGHRRRRRRQPGLDAHRRLRRVGRPAGRRALGRAGARPGWRAPRMPGLVGLARPRRQGVERAGPRAGRARRRWRAAGWPSTCWPSCPPGRVLAAGTGLPSLVARVPGCDRAVRAARADQVALGGRARRRRWASPASTGWRRTPATLLAGDDDAAHAAARRRCCPSPVDHVLLQADLTAVAPGPAGVRAGPHAAAARRRGVARRRHRLPLHPGVGAPGARLRLERPWRCTSSSGRCRAPRCRSR